VCLFYQSNRFELLFVLLAEGSNFTSVLDYQQSRVGLAIDFWVTAPDAAALVFFFQNVVMLLKW
jgi:hypothetical protein